MESKQIACNNLKDFLDQRQRIISDLAIKNTEEIVQREKALMDFELLLSVDLSKRKRDKLTKESRKLRIESWKELKQEANGDYPKMNEILNNI